MSNDVIEKTIIQTYREPLQFLVEVKDHVAALLKLIKWEKVGILYDDGPHATLVIFLNQDTVVATMRFCLNVDDSLIAIQIAQRDGEPVLLASCQGKILSAEDIVSIQALTKIWGQSLDQSTEIDTEAIKLFFERLENGTRLKGRGAVFTRETRTQVWFEAYGRCMFEGCGLDLTIDPITGLKGNYAYMAHNVAASESGPRGILYMSELLSDEPKNVLLLCDTHHRLIDAVAKVDYSAQRLSDMRRRFCDDAAELLNGLTKLPIPAYCVSWPVHRQVISAPSALQIMQSLVPIGARMDGRLNLLSDNESILSSTDPEKIWELMPDIIESTALKLLMQVHDHSYRAALFAIGLMPSLIALGAKLGNKCEITPMLRHRETGLWYWPATEPQGQFYDVHGIDGLVRHEDEIILRLSLTGNPPSMDLTTEKLGINTVTVLAYSESIGNGSLAHPCDGYFFRQQMQKLLHHLKDNHGVRLIHVLPCASNAACIFFGQAFDSYHPDLMVYDYAERGQPMVPRLRIYNDDNQCKIMHCLVPNRLTN